MTESQTGDDRGLSTGLDKSEPWTKMIVQQEKEEEAQEDSS